jgi:hypothetical protein
MKCIKNMREFIEKEFKAFLDSKLRNKWIVDKCKVKVYVRKSQRCFEGTNMVSCLDIATIEVDERVWNCGICRTTIQILESLNPFEAVYAENPCPLMQAAFRRWGWSESTRYPTCFYKIVK